MILAIETAALPTSVALVDDLTCIGEVFFEQQQTSSLISASIEKLLIDHSVKASAIKCIAVSIGPGSFTGLRVGLATAKGLAFALDCPITAISTLEVLAYNYQLQHPTNTQPILPLLNARRGKVFYAKYSPELSLLKPEARAQLPEIQQLEENCVFISPDAESLKEYSIKEKGIYFVNIAASVVGLRAKTHKRFLHKKEIAYLEPNYLINNYRNG